MKITKFIFIAIFIVLNHQNSLSQISIIGTSTPADDWETDFNLNQASFNENVWKDSIYLTLGYCKFRANNDWNINWGGSDYPIGFGYQDGPNIPIFLSGNYEVRIDTSSGKYVFSFLDNVCNLDSVVYVDQNVIGSNLKGDSWENALFDLESAINLAYSCPNINSIYMAQGVYRPSNRICPDSACATYFLTQDLNIYGGFQGFERSPDERQKINSIYNKSFNTILSGDLGQNDLDSNGDGVIEKESDLLIDSSRADNVYHVMVMEGASHKMVLDGLTFTAGYANGPNGDFYRRSGGGLLNDGRFVESNPTIRNCIFQGNVAADWGGGIVNLGDARPHFDRCDFLNNASYLDGGGFYNMADGQFLGSGSNYNASPTITNCTFKGNTSQTYGAALYNNGDGGGTSSPEIYSSLFSGNISQIEGVILTNGPTSICKLTNTTISNNLPLSLTATSGATFNVSNSILYGNGLNNNSQFGGNLSNYSIKHSIVDGISNGGIGIENIDPQFLNPLSLNDPIPNTSGNYNVASCGPSVDNGVDSLYHPQNTDNFDIAGIERISNGIDLGCYEQVSSRDFTASEQETDAYISLDWNVSTTDCNCLEEDPNLRQGVTVELRGNGILLNSWNIFKESFPESYSSSYRHNVGPDSTVTYELSFKRTGPGSVNCSMQSIGSTFSYRPPFISYWSEGEYVDSINIYWENRSWLTQGYNIIRDSQQIATIEANDEINRAYSFRDVFTSNDSLSIQNGAFYTYCLETESQIYQDIYTTNPSIDTCIEGFTVDIEFQASDDSFSDKVELTWKHLGYLKKPLQVVRNGVIIANLTADQTSFTDNFPIHGLHARYGIQLLNKGQTFVADYDFGSTPANGIIKGKVISADQKIPLENTEVFLIHNEGDTIQNLSTDFEGNFSFENLFYGIRDTFYVSASIAGVDFQFNPILVELNLNKSRVDDLVFLANTSLSIDTTNLSILDIFVTNPAPFLDATISQWQIQKNVPTDTVYFNLFRGSNLIYQATDITNSSNPLNFSYTDYDGIPDSTYTYSIQVYQKTTDQLIDTFLSYVVTFPPIQPVSNIQLNTNNGNRTITTDWTHNSDNFTGYNLYRISQNEEIIYADTLKEYTDLGGIANFNTGYFVRVFRTINGINYESLASDTLFVQYPDFDFNPVLLLTPDSDKDQIRISFETQNQLDQDYNYDGLNIIRYITGLDSTKTTIRNLSKSLINPNDSITIFDKSGIPNQAYSYEVEIYKQVEDTVTQLSSSSYAATFPKVSIPINLTSTSLDGRVQLDWSSPHTSDNIDGFVVLKGNNPIDSISDVSLQLSHRFQDIINGASLSPITYHILSHRLIDGIKYLSDTVSINADSPLSSGSTPIFLGNITATDDIPAHIKLCWDWTEPANQSPFIIRREGIAVATLPFTSRAFYDYDAPIGRIVTYSIETPGINNQLDYQLYYIQGYRPSKEKIFGKAFSADSQKGIADLDIELQLDPSIIELSTAFDTTQTIDLTTQESAIIINDVGLINNISVDLFTDHTYVGDLEVTLFSPQGDSVRLMRLLGLGVGVVCSRDSLDISFADQAIQTYTVLDQTCNTAGPIEGSFQPLDPLSNFIGQDIFGLWRLKVRDYYNQDQGRVSIELNINNNLQYSSTLYKSKTDSSGFYKFEDLPINPIGVTYQYTLQADSSLYTFADNPYNFDLAFGDSLIVEQYNFIDTTSIDSLDSELASIIAFTAIPNDFEMSMFLSWSPSNANYSGFEIYRGGSYLGDVLFGAPLLWNDTGGIPGNLTNYFIRPFTISTGSKVYGEFENTSALFPNILPVENLTAEAIDGENLISLKWSHPFENHDSYLINRDGSPLTTIQVGNPSEMIDSTGIPGRNYNYEVIALKGTNQSIPISINTRYPEPEPIRVFNLTIPTNEYGYNQNHLRLDWSYNTGAADNFIINRYILNGSNKTDERVIDRVSSHIRFYEDYTGLPNQRYHYEVIPTINRAGNEYVASRRDNWSENEIFPLLSPAILSGSIYSEGYVDITANYLHKGAQGVEFYRNDVLFGTLPFEDSIDIQEQTIIDRDGVPEQVTIYKMRAFTERDGQIFHSIYLSGTGTYPKPPTPQNFSASDGTFPNKIELTWTYDTISPIDNFYIERNVNGNGWEFVASLTGGIRSYTDYNGFQVPPAGFLAINYRISSIRKGVASEYNEDIGYLYFGKFEGGIEIQEFLGPIVFGYTVDMDGDWAVAGSFDGVKIFHFDGKTWQAKQEILPGINSIPSQAGFGKQVTISGNYIAVSAENEENDKGYVYVFERNSNDEFMLVDRLSAPGSFTGYKLDIIDLPNQNDILLVSQKTPTENNRGKVRLFERINGSWNNLMKTYVGNGPDDEMGAQVTIGKNYYVLKSNSKFRAFNTSNYTAFKDLNVSGTGSSMDINGVTMIYGDAPNVKVYNIFSAFGFKFFSLRQTINVGEPFFGESVKINDNKEFVVGSGFNETIRHYKQIQNTYVENNSITAPLEDQPSYFGTAVALSNDHIMVGSRLYNNQQGKVDFFPLETKQLGISVDISGDWAVGGSNGEGFSIYKRMPDETWSLHQAFTTDFNDVSPSSGFGKIVSISGKYLAVGAPESNQRRGSVYVFERDNQDQWNFLQKIINPANVQDDLFGYELDILDNNALGGRDLLAISRLQANFSNSGRVHIYRRVGNSFNQETSLGGSNSFNYYGRNVALSEHFLAIQGETKIHLRNAQNNNFSLLDQHNTTTITGDLKLDSYLLVSSESTTGVVKLFDLNNNDLLYFDQITNNINDFGESVSIIDENTVAISSPLDNKVDIYSNLTTSFWSSNQSIQNTDITDDRFGFSISSDQGSFIIGSPKYGFNEAGKVDFIALEDVSPPRNVTATDGTQSGQVTITWDAPLGAFDGYNIFRNGELLANMGTTQGRTFVDLPNTGLVPGKTYIYQIESTLNGVSSKSIGDSGFMPPNGLISGRLVTLQGNAPIQGAHIEANLMVDGNYLTYSATTDNLGYYTISDIYYGEVSEIEVSSTYLDHSIISQVSVNADPQEEDIILNLSINNNTNINANFYDITAFSVTGQVSHKDLANCFLDDVRIIRRYIMSNGPELDEETFTDAEGNYSFVIDPALQGLDEIQFIIDPYKVVNDDSIFFDFDAISQNAFVNIGTVGTPYIDNFNLNLNTKIDFKDQTEYYLPIELVNTCGEILSDGSLWTARIRSLDGCYEKIVQLNPDNTILTNVPPLELAINIVDVNNKTQENLIFLDYLINNPQQKDVFTLHKDEARNLSQSELFERLKVKLEYHKPAEISTDLSGFMFMCGDNTKELILQSGEEYTIPIEVFEQFDIVCNVSNGYLKIDNGAAKNTSPRIIGFNENLDQFPDYTFIAGSPNPVIPHAWNMTISYFSDSDVFQGSLSIPIIVEGSIQLEGNGIVTDASQGENVVPMPLYILRDPPGDRSYASIESGTEISRTISFADSQDSSITTKTDLDIRIFGIGGGAGIELTNGKYDSSLEELTITTKTTETISTFGGFGNNRFSVGRPASIIIGTGVVMQSGIRTSIEVSGCDRMKETRSVGFTPVELRTTWAYTVQFIEELIDNYERDIALINQEQLILYDENDNIIPRVDAVAKYTVLKENWEEVIKYYDVNTNPIYYYTQSDFEDYSIFEKKAYLEPINGGELILVYPFNVEANKWKEKLNEALDVNGDGTADFDIVFDQEKLDIYNNASTAIARLMTADPKFDDLEKIYNDWKFEQSRFDNENYYKSISGYQALPIAENKTFSGLVTQSNSFEQERSSNKSYSFGTYTDRNVYAKLGVNITSKTFAGLGAGIIVKTFESEYTTQLSGRAQGSISETETDASLTSSEVSYVLGDNDISDELSVTVLPGVALNHTPYFQLVGGSTSCPYEEGTLSIDQPNIQVLDPESGGLSKEGNLYFQDPTQAATFTILVTNLSSTQNTRDIEVFLDNNSNPDGAQVSIGGITIGSQTYTELGYNNPLYLTLSIERGQSFVYENLKIGVRPACPGDNIEDFITLSVEFQSPCSPVSITQPSNRWLINSTSPSLVIGLQDYIPSTANFEGLSLQYRRLGGASTGFQSGWEEIPYTNIKETGSQNNPVLPQTLLDHNNYNFGPGQTPSYFMVWEPDMGNASLFPDGDYELRVVSTCKEANVESYTYSNVVSGKIDRARLQLFGLPQPSDGIWIPGDMISASFNKNLDCISISNPSFQDKYLHAYVNGQEVLEANFTCFGNEIRMTVADMSIYDGQIMTVSIDSITNPNGNLAFDIDGFSREIQWDFLVTTSKAYWEEDSIVIQIYEGEEVIVSAGIKNTELQSSLSNLQLERSSNSSSWLTILPDTNALFDINPGSIRPITLTFTGSSVGVKLDTLRINNLPENSLVPYLPIKLITLKKPPFPPNWEVDGNVYPNSMTIVSNFEYNNSGVWSSDTMDMVSAWINHELRGVARISEINESTHAAYLTIYGNGLSEGEDIEFRVWDASKDEEFDGHATPRIQFASGAFLGQSINPRVLDIDTLYDKARYIHLNQGYTWISLNSKEVDMSVNHLLADVYNAIPGDRILSQNGFIEYVNDTLGWFADTTAVIDTMNTLESYMVFLQNGPDSIRMTGYDALPYTRILESGTNWIGYPSQQINLVENALGLNSLVDVQLLQNKDLSRINDGSMWTDGLLLNMIPNDGYQLTISSSKVITIPGLNANSKEGSSYSNNRSILADPWNASTWNIDLSTYTFKEVIPVVGNIIESDTIVQGDGNKKVAAFINGELRGVGFINTIDALSDDLFTLIIGSDDLINELYVSFYYYDGQAVSDSVNVLVSDLLINGSGKYTYLNPYQFSICPDVLSLYGDQGNLSGTYKAGQEIVLYGNIVLEPLQTLTLKAPTIRLIGNISPQSSQQLMISADGCNN